MLIAHAHLQLMQWLEHYLSSALMEYSTALEQYAADVFAMDADGDEDGTMDDDAVRIAGFYCNYYCVTLFFGAYPPHVPPNILTPFIPHTAASHCTNITPTRTAAGPHTGALGIPTGHCEQGPVCTGTAGVL